VDTGLKTIIVLINLFGVLLGLVAYYNQLTNTNPLLWIFVIDCPLSALLFTIVILGFNNPYFEALARSMAVKYSIWTFAVTFSSPIFYTYEYAWLNLLLHIGLILESFFFISKKLEPKHFIPALVFLLLNDLSDYFLGTHPPLNNSLFLETAIFTIILSLVSVGIQITYFKRIKKVRN